jgi:hypothetical protein
MNKKVSVGSGLPWRFTDKRFTAWGGMRIFDEVLRRLEWRGALSSAPLPQPGSNRGHDPALIVQAFLITVWTGGARFAHTAMVRFDEALRTIFGLAEVPSVSTFTRFFRRFDRRQVDEVFGHLSRWFWDRLSAQTWTIDLDSSVLTRYGHQEGSTRGYNPRRRGKQSHHPLMVFAAECRMVVTAWLRPGNTTDGCYVENFFGEVLATLGERHRIGLVRGDSGFCIGTLFDLLEEKKIDYIVVARMLGTLKRQIAGLQSWVEIDPGVAVAECEYYAEGWSKPRRVVAVRYRLQDRPQGQMLLEVPGYSSAVYVTSLRLPPEQVSAVVSRTRRQREPHQGTASGLRDVWICQPEVLGHRGSLSHGAVRLQSDVAVSAGAIGCSVKAYFEHVASPMLCNRSQPGSVSQQTITAPGFIPAATPMV